MMPHGSLSGLIALLLLAMVSTPCNAQLFKSEDRGVKARGNIELQAAPGGAAIIQTGDGTIIINNIEGIDPEVYGALAKKYGVVETAIEGFFRILDKQQVAPAEWDKTLETIAHDYKALREQVRTLKGKDPESIRLKADAEQALDRGDLEQAEVHLRALIAKKRQVREALQAAARTVSLEEAAALAALGQLKNTQLNHAEAAAHYREAAALLASLSEPLTRAGYFNEEGAAWVRAGQYAEARPPLETALSSREKVLGPNHPDTANSLNNLGALLDSQGDFDGAKPYYERALAIHEKVLGPNHPDTALSLNNLGFLLRAQGDLDGAKPYYQRALAIHEKVLGPNHPKTALSLNNLGALLDSQGDFDGAKPYYQRALAIHEKVLGPNHPKTALSLNNLGALLDSQGDFDGAKPYYQRALAIREKVLGPNHPKTALSLNNLGFLLQAQGDLDGAKPYYQRALAINEKVLGPNHPDTALSLNNLGFLLRAQGDLDGAKPYYQRALAIREKVLGPNHPDTATSLNNLGALLQAQGDLDGAKPYYEDQRGLPTICQPEIVIFYPICTTGSRRIRLAS